MEKEMPKYGIGQVVTCSLSNIESLTIKERRSNGLTWMYAFEETDLRCGEMYLQSVKTTPVSEKEIQELIKKWEAEKAGCESIAEKSKLYGNEAAYKEYMMQSFGYGFCISDLKALLNKG